MDGNLTKLKGPSNYRTAGPKRGTVTGVNETIARAGKRIRLSLYLQQYGE